MKYFNYKDEFSFSSELFKYLNSELPNFDIQKDKFLGDFRVDMNIEDRERNKNIIVEIKSSRGESSLPFSIIITLEKLKSYQNSEVILIGLSNINNLLKDRLEELNIHYLVKPEFSEVKAKINNIFIG